MADLTELGVVGTWLTTLLSEDATLMGLAPGGVYDRRAPEDAPQPYILFQYYEGRDVKGNGSHRYMVDATYIVRGVHESKSSAVLDQIAARVDVLLDGQMGAAGGGTIHGCTRLRPFAATDTYQGNDGLEHEERHLGGFYRIWASA